MDTVSFKWPGGYLVVRSESGDLVIVASNSTIRFSPREVEVRGLFQGLREHVEGARGERKSIYIDLAFPLRGLRDPQGVAFARHVDTYSGNYGLSYTVIEGVGYYLTVYPPPGSLYDHAVVAEDRIVIVTLSRRSVYVMEEDGSRKIILV